MIKKMAFLFILIALSVYIAVGSYAESSASNQTNQEYNNEMKSERDEFQREQKKAKEEMQREQEQTENEMQTENKEVKEEMAAEDKQVKAEMETERQAILKEFKTEREAMKALWAHRHISNSINQQSYDITSHTNVDFNNQDLKTTGISIANTPGEVEKAKRQAKQIALFKMRQLIGNLKPTNTESISQMEKKHPDMLPPKKIDQLVAQNAENHIKLQEKPLPGGKKAIYVSVVTPMNGENGVNKLVEPVIKQQPSQTAPVASPKEMIVNEIKNENKQAIKNIVAELHSGKQFSGLIIDGKQLGYTPCLFPTLEDAAGNVIYGPDSANKEVINSTGLVGWTRELKPARPNIRVGAEPLIIRAVGVKNGNILIVDNESANAIKLADNNSQFLENGRVVIAVQ